RDKEARKVFSALSSAERDSAKPYLGAKVQGLREKQADRERSCCRRLARVHRSSAQEAKLRASNGRQLQLENGFRKMPGGGSDTAKQLAPVAGHRSNLA